MSKKQKAATDQSRFEGNGISYRAKIIGVEEVAEPRGDEMCQETMMKLKEQVKVAKDHKKRVFVNITLEGLRIVDAESTSQNVLLHTHQVHQISFISRDVTDTRAFGYIYSAGDGTHKFFAIKTANAAENLVLSLRDLFQTVYEMKKKEIEEAKAAAGTEGEGETTAEQSTSNDQSAEGQESIYQVPKSNAPVNPKEQNLVDLEDQVDTILKGIEQIKNLEFDELTSQEAPRQPPGSPSVLAPPPGTAATNNPWAVPAATMATSPPASSALSSLQQLPYSPTSVVTSNPFGGMQAFPGTPVPSVGISAPGFGMVQSGAMPYGVQMAPMGGAPFAVAYGQQPAFGASPYAAGPMRSPLPGFAGASPAPFNPFGMAAPAMGMAPPQRVPVSASVDPFQAATDNLLQPIKPGGPDQQGAFRKSPTPVMLFGDLVEIKKGGAADAAAKSPREMFKELTQPPKKSLNELKVGAAVPAGQASVFCEFEAFPKDPFRLTMSS